MFNRFNSAFTAKWEDTILKFISVLISNLKAYFIRGDVTENKVKIHKLCLIFWEKVGLQVEDMRMLRM